MVWKNLATLGSNIAGSNILGAHGQAAWMLFPGVIVFYNVPGTELDPGRPCLRARQEVCFVSAFSFC